MLWVTYGCKNTMPILQIQSFPQRDHRQDSCISFDLVSQHLGCHVLLQGYMIFCGQPLGLTIAPQPTEIYTIRLSTYMQICGTECEPEQVQVSGDHLAKITMKIRPGKMEMQNKVVFGCSRAYSVLSTSRVIDSRAPTGIHSLQNRLSDNLSFLYYMRESLPNKISYSNQNISSQAPRWFTYLSVAFT